MKTLKALLSEGKIKLNPAKTIVRGVGGKTDKMSTYSGSDPIGWFSNKHNKAVGWAIYPLDKGDLKWFKDSKESTDMVFRVASDKGTSIVKINLKSNRILWFDNAKYVDTDKITWEKRWWAWDTLLIDNNTRAMNAFNTDGVYK